jgi:hypothetical protein
LQLHDLATVTIGSVEDDNLVTPRAAGQALGISFAGSFYENFHTPSNQCQISPAGNFIDQGQQALVSLFPKLFRNLIRNHRRRGIAPFGISEDVRLIIFNPRQITRSLQNRLLFLLKKPQKSVSPDLCTHLRFGCVKYRSRCITPVHQFQHAVASAERAVRALGRLC